MIPSMILIGNKLFSIVSTDDPIYQLYREFDPEHLELKFWDIMFESHRTTVGWWLTLFVLRVMPKSKCSASVLGGDLWDTTYKHWPTMFFPKIGAEMEP